MDKPKRILVVEDDPRLAELIRDYLIQQGFKVQVESRGDTAPARIQAENPDLLILDLMLPGKDGLVVCQEVRAAYPGPILIMTAREDDMDQVAGLEMGADDYIKKPVHPRVLLARIRALMRRVNPAAGQSPMETAGQSALCFGGLKISREAHQVFLDDEPVELSTNEFELLWLLASRAGQVLDRDRIMETIRGVAYDGLDRTVDVTISRLRRKLGDDAGHPRRIKTVWGQGYLFVKDAW